MNNFYFVQARPLPKIAFEAVSWLITHGADPNRERDNGETPFELAMKLGRTEIVELMRAHGGHD